jgi:hypothetical protein
VETLNKLDRQITEIVLTAEKKCAPKRNSTRWNPTIANISYLIRFFKVKLRCVDSPERQKILESILDQIQEPYRSEYLQSIDIHADPKIGMKQAKTLKKKSIQKMHSSREDHYFEVTKRFQPNLPKKAFRTQMYTNQCYRNINIALGKYNSSSFTTIDVPNPPDNDGIIRWSTLSYPQTIEEALIQRNIKHFGQAQYSPFASDPLATELGYEGTNGASMNVLNGKLPSSYLQCDETTQLIIDKLSTRPTSLTVPDTLSFDAFKNALRSWKEKTTTSPSGRHLGHYKCLLVDIDKPSSNISNEVDANPEMTSQAEIILQVYYHVLLAAIRSGTSLQRWQTSHTLMIQKEKGNSRIDRLRVIHIYEADYNLFLKIFWGRRLVYSSESAGILNEGQYGSRPGKKCSDQIIKKIMVYEYSFLSRSQFATMDNDAKSCFDRIVCLFAMLLSLFYGLSRNIVQIQATTLKQMKYVTKTTLGPSTKSYEHSPSTPIHGTGQGSCASPALWLHSSCFLMDILDNKFVWFSGRIHSRESTGKDT